MLCVHGFPETSYMWRELLGALAAEGRRAVAPDLPGFGDSPADPPGTWERHVEALDGLADALALPPVVLVVHDWGGLIGLRWACEHPERIAGLVISDTGFFADAEWHAMAKTMRTPGEGEEMLAALTRETFGQMLTAVSAGMEDSAIDEYWRALGTEAGQRAALELYRSGDFGKLAPYEGELGRLGVPALILWGEDDPFAPTAGARRFRERIPGSELEIVEGAGHFVYADAPARCATAIIDFLADA